MKILFIVIAIFTVQQSTAYTTSFLLFSFIFYLRDVNYLKLNLDTLIFVIMLIMQLPIALLGLQIPITGYPNYTFNTILTQLCYVLLLIYCITYDIYSLFAFIKRK